MDIPIAKPFLGDKEAEMVKEVLASGWISQGPRVAAFEKAFAQFVGAQFACAVSNCTTALQTSLLAVGVKPGDEVITVSHSFIATANSIRVCGAIPVFVDIQSDTFNMDPKYLEDVVTDKTKAILCVHQMGMPCDLEKIAAVSKKYKIPLLEDAACAAGSEYFDSGTWKKVGFSKGAAVSFSFHPRKVITTGDGGMITTNDPAIDRTCRLLRQHCMSVSDLARHDAQTITFEQYVGVGYNFRMTDIQAAVGLVQLERLPFIIKERRNLSKLYRSQLSKCYRLILPYEPEWAKSNWQSYCVRLPEKVDQKWVMQELLNQGINTRRGIMCAHLEPGYADQPWRTTSGFRSCQGSLRESEKAQNECVLLPLFPGMTVEQVEKISNLLISLLEQ